MKKRQLKDSNMSEEKQARELPHTGRKKAATSLYFLDGVGHELLKKG